MTLMHAELTITVPNTLCVMVKHNVLHEVHMFPDFEDNTRLRSAVALALSGANIPSNIEVNIAFKPDHIVSSTSFVVVNVPCVAELTSTSVLTVDQCCDDHFVRLPLIVDVKVFEHAMYVTGVRLQDTYIAWNAGIVRIGIIEPTWTVKELNDNFPDYTSMSQPIPRPTSWS